MNNLEQHFLANKFANIWTFAMPYTGWSLPIKKSTQFETNNCLFFMALHSLLDKWSLDIFCDESISNDSIADKIQKILEPIMATIMYYLLFRNTQLNSLLFRLNECLAFYSWFHPLLISGNEKIWNKTKIVFNQELKVEITLWI